MTLQMCDFGQVNLTEPVFSFIDEYITYEVALFQALNEIIHVKGICKLQNSRTLSLLRTFIFLLTKH